MRQWTGVRVTTLTLAILVWGLPDTAAIRAQQARVALVSGTIYPSPTEPPIPDGVVVIENGRISAVGCTDTMRVPEGVATLECSGSTITAGFWNSHAHFFENQWTDAANIPAPQLADQLRAMLMRYGFTSVFDLSSPLENTRRIRARIESGEVAGPRIRSTGAAIVGDGWMPPDDVLVALGVMLFRAPVVQRVGLDTRDMTFATRPYRPSAHLAPPPLVPPAIHLPIVRQAHRYAAEM